MSDWLGPLSARELAEGMTAANHNAARLLEDAHTLFAAKRWPSAAALAVLAIEEQAKEDILFAMATWPEERAYFWRAIHHRHTEKNSLALAPHIPPELERAEERLAWLNQRDPRLIERFKWRCLYVDCQRSDMGGPAWTDPTSVTEGEAREMVETADRLVERRVVSTEEIEILIKHVGPAPKDSMVEVNRAHAAYWREVVAKGLRPRRTLPKHLGIDWEKEPT